MNEDHIKLINGIVPLWYANVAWAKELLVRAFSLNRPDEILHAEFRGRRQIPGTSWYIRTHGIGVDIYKTPDVGGIDFDFDKPHPDEWRLRIFFNKQVNDGQLPYAQYRELVEDEELLKVTINAVLRVA